MFYYHQQIGSTHCDNILPEIVYTITIGALSLKYVFSNKTSENQNKNKRNVVKLSTRKYCLTEILHNFIELTYMYSKYFCKIYYEHVSKIFLTFKKYSRKITYLSS